MARGQQRNQIIIPQARSALDQLKYETASEVGLPNYRGYLGEVPSRLNGAVGGNMVRKMIQYAEQQLAGGAGTIPTQAQPAAQAGAAGAAGAPAAPGAPGAAAAAVTQPGQPFGG